MRTRQPLMIDVYRGPFVESTHQAVLSIFDARGIQVGFAGNHDLPIYPRSAIKMLQAIPFIETGAFEAKSLSQENIALACASHDGSEPVIKKLSAWLGQLGLPEETLACGPHDPVNKMASDQLKAQKKSPTKLMNNCSGKHLGMLTTALHKGESVEGYHLTGHPVQQRITKCLEELTKTPLAKSPHGVDGCGIPTYCAPIQAWAAALSVFLTSQPAGGAQRSKAVQLILESVKRYPELVCGTESFGFQVAQNTDSQVLVKSGAEAVYSGFLLGPGLAFCLKILDGSHRAASVVIAALIKEYASLTEKQNQALKPWFEPEIKNTRGEVVGQLKLRAF